MTVTSFTRGTLPPVSCMEGVAKRHDVRKRSGLKLIVKEKSRFDIVMRQSLEIINTPRHSIDNVNLESVVLTTIEIVNQQFKKQSTL